MTKEEKVGYQKFVEQNEAEIAWSMGGGEQAELLLRAFLAGIKHRDENPAWVSVEDRVPPVGYLLIVLADNCEVYVARHEREDGVSVWRDAGDLDYGGENVTHWLSLPPVPSE